MPATPLPPRYQFPAKLPSLVQMVRDAPTDPIGLMTEDILDTKIMPMPAPGAPVFICDPATAEEVLFDAGETWDRNAQLQRLMRRGWGVDGLAASNGELWRQQRRAVAPALRTQKLADYVPEMRRAVQDAMPRWLAQTPPLNLVPTTGRIVSQIVLTTLLTGHSDADFRQLAADIPEFLQRATRFGMIDMLPLPEAMIDRTRGLPSSPARKRLIEFTEALAAAREHGPDDTQDLPALLRGKGPLADNIFGFMMASFETTAFAAAWTLYLLALYPEWQDKLRQEADAAAHLTGDGQIEALTQTRSVVREALRLYPPAPITARAAMKKTELLGVPFSRGQVALIGVYPMHRHRKLWDNPDGFDPNRARPAHRATYIPFSAGPRMCVAASFAETEIMMIVSEVLRHISLTPAGPEPEINLSVSTNSSTGINVAVSPR